jgi:outer membrane receptor for ferrienterochelin and colicins
MSTLVRGLFCFYYSLSKSELFYLIFFNSYLDLIYIILSLHSKNKFSLKKLVLLLTITFSQIIFSQEKQSISGQVTSQKRGLNQAEVALIGTKLKIEIDSIGNYKFENLAVGNYKIQISAIGYETIRKSVNLKENENLVLNFDLKEEQYNLNEVVVSGTLKPVRRLESPVPVEVYSPAFIKKNPTPSIFEALQNINGIRPQVNCGICNTGDIRINGLEGAYTFVLIDGMPIVSALSTVYGLSGIPNSLIERIEVVKGPASSLYGSEAVGGLINIITKNPINAPVFSADYFSTSYLENNLDVGMKFKPSKKTTSLLGFNYFKYDNKVDNDKDGFTDLTLQDRISVFNKWTFERNENRLFTIAVRGLYEDRWGGDLRWEKKYRGGNEIYGESIYTKRGEFFGNYQLPTSEKIMFSFSGNVHFQDSRYGNTSYIANQKIAFGQLTWDKKIKNNDFLVGLATRFTHYDDNTPATTIGASNVWLPGIFVQNEITFNEKNKLLLGIRYDYNSVHGNIFTPRMAYKLKINDENIVRLNAGTGFRVVNIFSEDHSALTGSRTVELKSDLKPEQSINVNLNYMKHLHFDNGNFIDWETSFFYTRFNSKVFVDYETDGDKIIYSNINGYSLSQGISTNFDVNLTNGLKLNLGATIMDVENIIEGEKMRPFFTEKFTGSWGVTYQIPNTKLSFDYTGNFTGLMLLPLINENDPRSPKSPNYSIQNIQITLNGLKGFEFYGGIKNLLNFTPKQNNPYLIARTNDPFDQNVQFDANNQPLVTQDNPYGATFDTLYVYAQNQGIRGFFGLRYILK